jgi:hypothetical protein
MLLSLFPSPEGCLTMYTTLYTLSDYTVTQNSASTTKFISLRFFPIDNLLLPSRSLILQVRIRVELDRHRVDTVTLVVGCKLVALERREGCKHEVQNQTFDARRWRIGKVGEGKVGEGKEAGRDGRMLR